MRKLDKSWLSASRPKTLPAAVSPVFIGTALAFHDGKGHWLSAILAAICALLIQIGTNYANDYFDYKKGADSGQRLGPTRVTQAGLIKPKQMEKGFIFIFTLSAVVGLYLLFRGGLPVLFIGLFSIAAGILYTGGPYPLGYHGLGDIFVFLFFGLVAVGGTYYVQALSINWIVIMAGIAPGLLSTAILTVNNLRDIESDRLNGKVTLAVFFGARFARIEYLVCLIGAALIPVILFLLNNADITILISSFFLFFSLPSLKTIFTKEPGKIYNKVLADTGKLLFLYSLLFSVSWCFL